MTDTYIRSTIKKPQLDWSTLHVGPPVEARADLGVLYGQDLVPYTAAQKELLETARPRQLRYVIETNSLYYLSGHPSNPYVRWRPIQTSSTPGGSPEFSLDIFSGIATTLDANGQMMLFHDTDGSVDHPTMMKVIENAIATHVVYPGTVDEAVYVDVAGLAGTIEVFVNGQLLPMVTIDLVAPAAGQSTFVHGWYPYFVSGPGSNRYYIAFERPGPTGINTSEDLPKVLAFGDHVQAVAAYFKAS